MNPLEFLKKAQMKKDAGKKGKGKMPFPPKKGKAPEGSAEEEKAESPMEEMKEMSKGKGDAKDKYKGMK